MKKVLILLFLVKFIKADFSNITATQLNLNDCARSSNFADFIFVPPANSTNLTTTVGSCYVDSSSYNGNYLMVLNKQINIPVNNDFTLNNNMAVLPNYSNSSYNYYLINGIKLPDPILMCDFLNLPLSVKSATSQFNAYLTDLYKNGINYVLGYTNGTVTGTQGNINPLDIQELINFAQTCPILSPSSCTSLGSAACAGNSTEKCVFDTVNNVCKLAALPAKPLNYNITTTGSGTYFQYLFNNYCNSGNVSGNINISKSQQFLYLVSQGLVNFSCGNLTAVMQMKALVLNAYLNKLQSINPNIGINYQETINFFKNINSYATDPTKSEYIALKIFRTISALLISNPNILNIPLDITGNASTTDPTSFYLAKVLDIMFSMCNFFAVANSTKLNAVSPVLEQNIPS